jgi:hypothetical protein
MSRMSFVGVASAAMVAVILVACDSASTQGSRISPGPSVTPSAVTSPSPVISPSPVVSLPALRAGWTWYADNQLGYAVGIAPEWTHKGFSDACPNFTTNTRVENERQFGPTDNSFGLCVGGTTLGGAASCQTPHNIGAYTPISVAGIQTYESVAVGDGKDWPAGFRSYQVDVPGNGTCYALSLRVMSGVSQQKVDELRTGVWSTFTVYPVGWSVASSARTT